MNMLEVSRKKFMLLLFCAALAVGIFAGWFLSPSRKPANRASRRWEIRWSKRHKQLKRNAAESVSRIAFLGDSITQNWETAGQAIWEKYYGDRGALNLGISSDKTQHVLWRVLDTHFGKQPELIVLLIGTNNSLDYLPEETATGIGAIIQALQEKAPGSKVLLLAIFPRGETLDDPRRAVNEDVNKLLRRFADGERVTYLDVNHVFTQDTGTANLELMPDGLHLNEAGYAAWAAAMEPTISALMKDALSDDIQK